MPRPVSQQFLSNLGPMIEEAVALQRQGRTTDAEKIYGRILKTLPDHFDALHLLAQIKMERGKPGEAYRLMRAAVAARPDLADARVHLGLVLRTMKQPAEALASFEKASALDPGHIDALGHRGDVLIELGRPGEALDCFDRILALAPGHPAARVNRGVALAALARPEEALAEFDALIAAGARHPMALYNRARVLADLGRYAESLGAYDALLALVPQHSVAWNNRGNVLVALNRHADASASFDRAIALQTDYADAHFNQSLALLALGDFARGFRQYEWRWKRTGMAHVRHNYRRPLWLGETPLQRKTILLHAEQGLGDTIHFARYAAVLARAGATVVLEVQRELKPLLSRLEGVATVLARGEPLPPFDLHCPLGSLPLACKTEPATIPADIPYVQADDGRLEKWRARIGSIEAPRVALAWAGNPAHANDRNRSIALSRLRPIWTSGAARTVSIQHELRSGDAALLANEPGIVHIGDEFADLDDAAAVVALCDLVITVDTSIAHLAAAMGRPVWILLPFSADWRWTTDRETSPWYPTARLFRQTTLGDWDDVIMRAARELPSALRP
jgi:tetratricopeptide (TPR) repeat protein